MMPGISLNDIAQANNAALLAGSSGASDICISGVSIDSRTTQPGDVFVALPGERVDGHAYIDAAMDRGAQLAVVEQQSDCSIAQIIVDDSRSALAAIAELNRDKFEGPVVAVTGSAGKTTCKNMIAELLAGHYSVCATQGNLNNELGVPLTVSRLSSDHSAAVIEMGAAQRGDIDYLTTIAKPAISVLTNVNEAHVGRFGNLQTTAKTKGEIFNSLPDGGIAVLNLDDAYADMWQLDITTLQQQVNIVSFSLYDSSASVFVDEIQASETGTEFQVTLNFPERKEIFRTSLPLLGVHNVANAAAAIAVAVALDVPATSINEALSRVAVEAGRLQPKPAQNEILVIDDSYNANPQAMLAAAAVLHDVAKGRDATSVMVLGDMGELGELAAEKHVEVGCRLAEQGIDALFAVGEYADQYATGFEQAAAKPMAEQNAGRGLSRVFASKADLAAALLQPDFRKAVVLVKGSRFAAMDEVVNLLSEHNMSRQEV